MQSPLFRRYGIDEATFWEETNKLAEHYRKRGYHLSPEFQQRLRERGQRFTLADGEAIILELTPTPDL